MSATRFLSALERLIEPERLVLDPGRASAYACDGLTQFRRMPLAVAHPKDRQEVQDLVRLCRREEIPITARGAGTGLAGGATPTAGGLVIATNLLRQIRSIDLVNHTATVEPGVPNAALNAAVKPHGLLFAPDPSSQSVSTLGGNAAANAGGPHALKYGSTREHVLALEVVMSDGEVVELGSPAPAGAGADLRALFVGSEGTLGITTALTVRLSRRPRAVTTLSVAFPTMRDACEAVGKVIAAGILPAALEAMDDRAIRIVEASGMKAGFPQGAGAVLLFELDGHPVQVQEDADRVSAICRAHRAQALQVARDEAEAAKLWRGRKAAFGAMGRLAPDLYVLDTVVPRSKLKDVLPQIEAIGEELDLVMCNVFHAGDGNLHPSISYDGRDPAAEAKVALAGKRIAEICLAASGTLSGEHGIGLEKRDFMPLQFSEADLAAQECVRKAFDPRRLLNPDKKLPTTAGCGEMRTRRSSREGMAPQA